MTPCMLVGRYHCFGEICCWGSWFRTVDTRWCKYMVSHPVRLTIGGPSVVLCDVLCCNVMKYWRQLMDKKIQKSKFIYGQFYDCIWRQIKKLLKLLLGVRIASNTAFCHQQLYYCYHLSESSELYSHSPQSWFSVGVCHCLYCMWSGFSNDWFDGATHMHEALRPSWENWTINT